MALILGAAIWLVCAVLAVGVSVSKGRGACLIGLLSLFSGPIALIVALLLTPDHDRRVRKEIAQGKLAQCIRCGRPVHYEVVVCASCRQGIGR